MLLSYLKQLLGKFRLLGKPQRYDPASESDIFPKGFNLPMGSPMGVIHEVYSVRSCGEWGYTKVNPNGEVESQKISGQMYSLRCEVEILDRGLENDIRDHSENPTAFSAANPHRLTKRVIMDVWMTDEDLIEHAIM